MANSSPSLLRVEIVVALLTVLAYSPSLRGPQLFDDEKAIQANPTITQLWPISVPLHPPVQTALSGRPVVNYSFALNYWLNGLLGVDQRPDPDGPNKTIGYHVVSIALHIGCGLLLFGIIRRTLRGGRLGDQWAERADSVALVVTALWLLHPLQTDAVDYLVQRTEVLVALCYLATLYCSVRAWDASHVASRRWWFVAGAIACALGMGSKEVMVSAPLIVMLYDRAFRLNSWRESGAPAYRDRWWFYAALIAALSVLVALLAETPRGASVGFDVGVPWYEYLHSQGWAIAHYLRLVFWPSGLSLDYGSTPVAHWRGVPGLLLLSCLGVVTLVAWTRANRWGWLAFLGSWFFLILAPSSSVVPVVTEIAAERRMYLPLAAVLLALLVAGAAIVRRFAPRCRFDTGLRRGAIIVAGALAVLTFERSRLYQSPEALWRDAVAKVPGNARAWYNLGAVLDELPVPQHSEADSDYREAVKRDSSNANALLRLVFNDVSRGQYIDAQTVLRQYPLGFGNDTVLAGLGAVFLDGGDTTGALLVLERMAERPSSVATLVHLGNLYLAARRPADAVSAFRRAIVMSPSRTDLMVELSGMLMDQRHAEQAEPYLEEAVRREPESGLDLALLSLADAEAGRSEEAVREADLAMQHEGLDERVDFFAGRAMLDDRRADLADSYLTRAVALDPRDPDAIADLGEAKLVLGHENEAIALFERALSVDPDDSIARTALARLR